MTSAQENFFRIAPPAAIASLKATGVLASVTLAQCALESGWLARMPAGSNNCFGIKATDTTDANNYVRAMTSEYIDGELREVLQPFVRFASLAECFTAHGNLLAGSKRYAPCMAVWAYPCSFACQLQECGYSTAPDYAARLIFLMEHYHLMTFDAPASAPATATATEAK